MFKFRHIANIAQLTRDMMMPGIVADMSRKVEQMEANEEYIAMMSDIELPDEEVNEDVSEVHEG